VTRARSFLAASILLAATAGATRADDTPAFKSAFAKEAVTDHANALKRADDDLAARTRDARAAFDKKLELATKAAMKDGDLDEANRLSAVRKSFDAELDVKDELAVVKSNPAKEARTQLETAIQRAKDDHAKRITDAEKTFAKKLDLALKEAMRQGDLDEAKRIEVEKKATEDELASNELKRELGWLVLFRSSDPTIWNTESTSKGEKDYAIPIGKAPRLTRYLRLRRTDTNAFVIIPMTKDKLGARATDGDIAWEGSLQFAQGGRHLGIDRKSWHCTVQDGGKIMVTHDRGNRGWGFGHKVHVNDKQYWAWAGEEIPETVLEISVKTEALTKAEADELLK